MSTGPAGGGYHTSEDEQILHRMGYAQELFRAMGGFQNFAISFTIISILAGCLTSYYIAFNNGGPIAITWGWLHRRVSCHARLARDGRDRLDVPDRRRPLLLVVEARQPRLGLVHGLVQPRRPDRGHRGDRLRRWRSSRRRSSTSGSTTRTRRSGRSSRTRRDADRRRCSTCSKVSITAMLNTISACWHMAGVAFIVLVLIIVPDNHQSVELRVHGDDQQLRLLGHELREHRLLVRVRPRPADVAVHDHGLRRLGAHGRGDAPGVADGRRRHVHVGRRLGHLRLDPAARRDVRGARTRRACSTRSAAPSPTSGRRR